MAASCGHSARKLVESVCPIFVADRLRHLTTPGADNRCGACARVDAYLAGAPDRTESVLVRWAIPSDVIRSEKMGRATKVVDMALAKALGLVVMGVPLACTSDSTSTSTVALCGVLRTPEGPLRPEAPSLRETAPLDAGAPSGSGESCSLDAGAGCALSPCNEILQYELGGATTTGSGAVGDVCEGESGCAAGLRCLRPASQDYFEEGGPARGYCSADCESDTDCRLLDRSTICHMQAGVGLCLRSCLSKDPEPNEGKCLGRQDLVCASNPALGKDLFLIPRQDGRCLPRCAFDGECPSGHLCNPATGVCSLAPVEGLADGEPCSEDDDCAGNVCLRAREGASTCSAHCTLGALQGCGYSQATDTRPVGCVEALVRTPMISEGIGDLGLCRELCSTDANCAQAEAGWRCRPVSSGVANLDRVGTCVPGN